jgi:o-succinylbenzoate synthase
MKIKKIVIYKKKIPLKTPYSLAYKIIHYLDSIFTCIQTEDGKLAWGESTPLIGYNKNNIEQIFNSTNCLAKQYIGKSVHDILKNHPSENDGFLYSAIYSPIEELARGFRNFGIKIPLAGLIQEKSLQDIESCLGKLRQEGFKTFKIKAGFLPIENDLQRIKIFQEMLFDNEVIRIDANQSLNINNAEKITCICNPTKIQFLEQPLKHDAWFEHGQLAKNSPIPIMLDESISDLDSLKKTAEFSAASFIKLKLMKQGSFENLKKMTELAKQLNLKIVIGNGVSTFISNRGEAIFWAEELAEFGLAGEMNGYLKTISEYSFCDINFSNFADLNMPLKISDNLFKNADNMSYIA